MPKKEKLLLVSVYYDKYFIMTIPQYSKLLKLLQPIKMVDKTYAKGFSDYRDMNLDINTSVLTKEQINDIELCNIMETKS